MLYSAVSTGDCLSNVPTGDLVVNEIIPGNANLTKTVVRNPHAFKSMMSAELRRYSERPHELQPAIDAAEAFLLAAFLRRYITYCARRGRFTDHYLHPVSTDRGSQVRTLRRSRSHTRMTASPRTRIGARRRTFPPILAAQ